jgi:endonuclease/exonuclease/phosphatase family metal-dependent hydrolase
MLSMTHMRVLTYNIHRGRGLDGQQRLDRIIDVLGEVDADIVALQEVLAPHVAPLAEATGMHVVFGQTRVLPQGPYGNVCLTRRPFEPRGCLRADVDGGSRRFHIFNVHLGLRYGERIRQVRMLSGILDPRALQGPRLLLGDFNEWFNGQASRLLRAEFGHPCGRRRGVRTHPSVLPVFPLDRIYHDPPLAVERVVVHRSRLARVASDHLPTYADLRVQLSG